MSSNRYTDALSYAIDMLSGKESSSNASFKHALDFALNHLDLQDSLNTRENCFAKFCGEPKSEKVMGQLDSMKSLLYPKSQHKTSRFFEDFITDLRNVSDFSDNDEYLATNVNHLLFRHFYHFPAPVKGHESSSLYQFLRTYIAALNCFSQAHELVIIGGDLSGIQSYLFEIISKHASNNLKGRSAYLDLLVKNACHELLHVFDIDSFNIIYSSGGGFYILAPAVPDAKQRIEKLRQNYDQKLYENHKHALYLAIDFQSLEKKDNAWDFVSCWSQITNKMGAAKRKRFLKLSRNNYDSFFEPASIGGDVNVDAITGEIITNSAKTKSIGDRKILLKNQIQIDLGKALKKAEYWIKGADVKMDTTFQPLGIGQHHVFTKNQSGERNVYRVNAIEKELPTLFYGGNHYPLQDDGSSITFDQLARGDNFKRLGILRMDVDFLGTLFQQGHKQFERLILADYATLSNELDSFFSGYINHIQKELDILNTTYIVYSGGDDLFVVGHWEDVIEFSAAIQKEFQRLTNYSKIISISAGIKLVRPKFPIMKAAEMAGDALDEHAKNFIDLEGIAKNAIHFLNETVSWGEFEQVEKWKNTWKQWLSDGLASKSLLYKMYHYHSLKNQGKLNYKWHSAYHLKRYQDRSRKVKLQETKAMINELQKLLITSGEESRGLTLCIVGAKWAELNLRTNNKLK